MTDHVDATLKLWRTTPFTWGGVVPHIEGWGDCLLSVGEHMARYGSPDLTGEYRGRYSDEAGAMALVRAAGGVSALIDRMGWRPTTIPLRGDVVVIAVAEGVEVGGICTGAGIACRLERGAVELGFRFVHIVKVWSCPR